MEVAELVRLKEERPAPVSGRWPDWGWGIRVGEERYWVGESRLLAYFPDLNKFLFRTPEGRHFYVYTYPIPMLQPISHGRAYLSWLGAHERGEVVGDFFDTPDYRRPDAAEEEAEEVDPIPLYCPRCNGYGRLRGLEGARQKRYPWCLGLGGRRRGRIADPPARRAAAARGSRRRDMIRMPDPELEFEAGGRRYRVGEAVILAHDWGEPSDPSGRYLYLYRAPDGQHFVVALAWEGPAELSALTPKQAAALYWALEIKRLPPQLAFPE